MSFLESTEKKRIAIYIRVSTSEQSTSGYGLDVQRQRLEENITYLKDRYIFNRASVYDDVHTGSELKTRPGLQKLLEAVKAKKYDTVMVWKIDRLSRNLKHLLNVFEIFEENDVSFVSLQENIDFRGPMGKLIFQIFGAIGQFERELIKGRTQAGITASAKMNNYVKGQAPYGYKKVKVSVKGHTLEIVSDEANIVRQIYSWYIFDSWGYGTIAAELNKRGVPSNRKHRGLSRPLWSEKMVRGMLSTTEYYGAFKYIPKDIDGEEYVLVTVPPIIEENLYCMAQEVKLEKPAGKNKHQYLLSGKIVDMSLPERIDTHRKFVGAQRNKGGFSYRRKQFQERDGTHHKLFEVPGAVLEEYVWKKVEEGLKDPDIFIKKYFARHKGQRTRIDAVQSELASIRRQIAEAEIKIEKITDKNLDGFLSDEDATRRILACNTQIKKQAKRKHELENELKFLSSIEVETMKLKNAAAVFKDRLAKIDARGKKLLINLFVERIEMYRTRKEGEKPEITINIKYRFNPETLLQVEKSDRTGKQLPAKAGENILSDSNSSGAARRI